MASHNLAAKIKQNILDLRINLLLVRLPQSGSALPLSQE